MQAQPVEFGAGFGSIRIWINGMSSPRVYLGNLPNSLATTKAALSLCCRFKHGDSSDCIENGHFDMMNFVWFDGSEGLFENSSGIYDVDDEIIQFN